MDKTMILQAHKKLDNTSYKIVCKCSDVMLDFVEAQQNVAKMFDNKFHVVKNSVKYQGSNLFSMIVKANVKSLALDCLGEKSNKRLVTAGVYTDSEDNSIWEVKTIAGEKRLVLKDQQDLEACFKYGKSIATASLNTTVEPMSGDFVTFYNKNSSAVECGFALVAEDGEMEVFTEDEQTVPVNEDEIINAADLTECELNPVEAAIKNNDKSKVLDYMKKIYKNSEMMSNLKSIMDYKEAADKNHFSTVAGVMDNDFEEIKADIQNFIVNKAVDDLRDQISMNSNPEPVVVEQGNCEGDLDFASDAEMQDYLAPAELNLPEQPIVAEEDPDEDDFADVAFEDQPITPTEQQLTDGDVFVDSELNDLLQPEQVEITSESELDGDEEDFVEMEAADVDEDKLVENLANLLNIQE